jgi:hypothetical protein
MKTNFHMRIYGAHDDYPFPTEFFRYTGDIN